MKENLQKKNNGDVQFVGLESRKLRKGIILTISGNSAEFYKKLKKRLRLNGFPTYLTDQITSRVLMRYHAQQENEQDTQTGTIYVPGTRKRKAPPDRA